MKQISVQTKSGRILTEKDIVEGTDVNGAYLEIDNQRFFKAMSLARYIKKTFKVTTDEAVALSMVHF